MVGSGYIATTSGECSGFNGGHLSETDVMWEVMQSTKSRCVFSSYKDFVCYGGTAFLTSLVLNTGRNRCSCPHTVQMLAHHRSLTSNQFLYKNRMLCTRNYC